MKTDVLICGGSLAGAAAAIRLHQHGITPLIVEKARFPRKKLCGEFLGPDSVEPLQKLGVWDNILSEGYGPIREARFFTPKGKSITIPMAWINPAHPFGLGISREKLDWLLLSHCESIGIPVWQGVKVYPRLRRKRGLFITQLLPVEADDAQGAEQTIESLILVDATGRHGGLVLHQGQSAMAHPKRLQKVGVKVNVRLPTSREEKTLDMFLFPGGYGGIQPLSAEVHNVCFLGEPHFAKALQQPFPDFVQQTIGQNPKALERLKDAIPIEPFQTTANLNVTPHSPAHSEIIQVGDAMVTIDPFTGSGMTMALETGILAADCIAQGLQHKQPYETIQRHYSQRFQRQYGLRLKLLRFFRPYLFSPMWPEFTLPLFSPMLPTMARVFR